MYFHVYLIYRFTRTFTDHSSVITRCWGFELQNGKSSLKSPQTLAAQDFAPASFLSTPDTSEQTSYRLLRLFYKSQSALILLLLLSKSQPLRWVVICCRRFAAFFDCGKRSGLNGACRKRWSQTGSQFSFQRERRPFAGAPVAGRPVRGDGHRQRPFGRKSRK